MMEKRCILPGCAGIPMHGRGLASRGPVRWACPAHVAMLDSGATAAPDEGGRQPPRAPGRASSPPPRQGRLL